MIQCNEFLPTRSIYLKIYGAKNIFSADSTMLYEIVHRREIWKRESGTFHVH